jgi:Spondin_N
MTAAGDVISDRAEGKQFFIDQKNWDKNFAYLPPLKVNKDHSYISGISGLAPSPDWYTDFYLFQTIKESTETYWEAFLLRTYPWDAGSDDGTFYTDTDHIADPPKLVTRIDLGNTPGDIFKNPSGDQVRHVAEWECVLHTCPLDQPDCVKPNWPPKSNCDILKYPECDSPCDPAVEHDCQQCQRESQSESKVFFKDCCKAGRVPKDGRSCTDDQALATSDVEVIKAVSLLSVAAATMLAAAFLL